MTILMILLAILRWLLIIVLSILAFVLLIILLVLIMPIRYKADIVYGGGKDLDVNVKVTYFWPIIRFFLTFSIVNKLHYKLKVLFFSIIDSDKPKKDKEEADNAEDDVEYEVDSSDYELVDDHPSKIEDENLEPLDDIEEGYESSDDIAKGDKPLEDTEDVMPNEEQKVDIKLLDEVEEFLDKEIDSDEDEISSDEEFKDEHYSIFDRIGAFFKGISIFFKGIKKGIIKVQNAIDSLTALIHNIVDSVSSLISKIKEIKVKADEAYKKGKRFKRLWDAEATKNTLSLVKKQLFNIIKHILPNKVKGYIHYGFDDPATTGEVLAVISAFYPVLSPHFEIVPDFDGKALEADVHIKGRIHLIYIVGCALRILISPDTIRTIKRTKHILGR